MSTNPPFETGVDFYYAISSPRQSFIRQWLSIFFVMDVLKK